MFRKLLAILVSTALFLTAFAVFVFLLIPVESFSSWMQHKVNESETVQIDIGETERMSQGTIVLREISLDLDFSAFRKAKKKPEEAHDAAVAPAPAEDLKPGALKGKGAAAAAFPPPAKGGALAGVDVSGFGFEPEGGHIDIDELKISVSPWDLLSPGSVSVEFSMDLLGGVIDDAEMWFSKRHGYDMPRVYIGNIEDLDMEQAPALGALFSAIIPYIKTGQLMGSIDAGSVLLEPTEIEAVGDAADAGAETLTKYVGEISLSLADVVARGPVFLLRFKKDGKKIAEERFRLTDLRLGDCDFVIKVAPPSEMKELTPDQRKRDGTAVLFSKGVCSGDSIDIALRKKSYLRIPEEGGFKAARINFWIKSAYSSEYFREEEKEDGVVVTQNHALDQAMRFKARGFQRAQDVDGYYWMNCIGPLSKAQCKRRLPPEEKRRKKAAEDRKKREKDEARKAERAEKEAARKVDREAARKERDIRTDSGKPDVKMVSPPGRSDGTKRADRPTIPRPENGIVAPGTDDEGLVDEPLDNEPLDEEGLDEEGFDEEGFDDEGEEDEEPLEDDEGVDDEGEEPSEHEDDEGEDDEGEDDEGEEGDEPLEDGEPLDDEGE